MRSVFACLLLLATLLSAPFAEAQNLLGDTRAPYSADRTVVTGGKSYVGRVYAEPGRQRHEQDLNGLPLVAILRADRKVAWLELAPLHVFTDFPFPAAITDYADDRQLGPALGTETVGGEATKKYRIERQGTDGSQVYGYAWITDDGIVMKLDGAFVEPSGRETRASYELSHVKRGPQPPALFDLPAGMSRLPPEALAPLMGIKLKPPARG
ncbi:hypothetical protein GCM10011611_24640 [Aliidongia dinghuensis]|uniref:DUF4412 domain-containing protein n=1 Tax=Aliidongia dinghuensis TaxID=1867774 RepID=A0A8J2YU07_9PROT|nr:hypothetical protein [Aliidongia dinghuensis]GGF17849.1 hypothetical protein GCM10011611_24640 [Aliidongia dinghuensis]